MPPNSLSFEDMTDSQKMLVISLALNSIQGDVERHNKILVTGNGDLPLTEKVRNLEKFADTIRFWFRTVAVALVLQTITFGITAVWYGIRFYPLLERIASQQP